MTFKKETKIWDAPWLVKYISEGICARLRKVERVVG
jgi:hypothetical protein